MSEQAFDKTAAVAALNRILELEMAGVVRYTHYSFMIYGYSRIPIVSWLRGQADESLLHAQEAGEMITYLGEHPSLALGPLLSSHKHDVGDILRESLEHERASIVAYRSLLEVAQGHSIMLEEYARRQIAAEEQHAGDISKMLRPPG